MKCKEEKSMEINSNVNTMAGINLMYRGIKKGTFLFISKVNEELKRTILSITPVWRFQEVRTSFHPNSLKVNSAILNVSGH